MPLLLFWQCCKSVLAANEVMVLALPSKGSLGLCNLLSFQTSTSWERGPFEKCWNFNHDANIFTVLQDGQFAALKEREYFWRFQWFLAILSLKKHHFEHFYQKNGQKFTKLVILVAKNHQNLKKIKDQYLFLSAANWPSCSTVKMFCWHTKPLCAMHCVVFRT